MRGSIRSFLPSLGSFDDVSNEEAITLLDMEFTDPAESIRTSAKYLIDNE